MSRYNGNNGANGGSNDNDYDDTTLKLSKYAAVRLTPESATSYTHNQYGTSYIVNYDDSHIVDGVVLQREDKPGTWKVFSAGKFFNMNPEDGLIYENFDEEEGYSGEMSAQDILDAPRVSGYSDSAGGTDYYYTPVGVVIEESGDIAINDDLDVETTPEPTIHVGESSMLLSNNSWVRTFAKKTTQMGDAVINDNGEDPTPRGEPDDNPKYTSHNWLNTETPDLRDEIVGRDLELWVTEQTQTWDDGEESTFPVPNLMDLKTENMVTIDNGIESDDSESESSSDSSEKAAATDGGTATKSGSSTSETSSTTTTDSPDNTSGLPDGVPDSLEELIDYFARNNDDVSASQIREFAEDEVDNPDDVNWEAAAEVANSQ